MEQGENSVPVVYLHEISRRYRQGEATLTILDGATLALWEGQSVALIAPSGTGACAPAGPADSRPAITHAAGRAALGNTRRWDTSFVLSL